MRRAGQQKLRIVPCDFDEAKAFVRQHHLHHKPPVGHKFSLAVADESNRIRGVAIVGRPIARMDDNGWTLEILRVATDGCPNAGSALWRASWRVTRELGYRRLITCNLPQEGGVSLEAAGFKCLGECGGGSWNRASRPRVDKHPTQIKMKWALEATD